MTISQRRSFIVKALGGKCVICGKASKLHLDHKQPRHWNPSRLSRSKRMAAYERALKAGKLQLLCPTHHGVKTNVENGDTPWLWGFKQFMQSISPF